MGTVRFQDVYENDDRVGLLYELLKERDETINVKHTELPPLENHRKFVESRPYEVWNFVKVGCEVVGSAYITGHNEVGIFIFKRFQGRGYGKDAVMRLLVEFGHRDLVANINPRNKKSISLFESLGFKRVEEGKYVREGKVDNESE